ncbi:MAG: hypothetical protein WAO58_09965 [Fimbriimonadaceae bacterium]
MDQKVFSSIGYGFCPPSTVDPGSEGVVELTYRYVPSQLVDNDERRIIGGFNRAAELGALDDAHADIIELGEFDEADELTEKGHWLFQRMPVYAILRIEEPFVEWQAFWEGEPAITVRAEQLEPLVEEALKLPPQQLWAQKHLGPVAHYLYGANDPEAAAMPLAPGLEANGEHSEDLPRAAVEERVEYPWGLWKIVLIAIEDGRAADFAEWLDSEVFQIVEGTVGVLREGRFSYESVPFIRWELPASLVPNVIRWAEQKGIRRVEPWAPIAVMPYYDWQSPIASLPLESESLVGLAAAYTVPIPPKELDREFLRWMELEIQKQIS